jgi:hypothetical protein
MVDGGNFASDFQKNRLGNGNKSNPSISRVGETLVLPFPIAADCRAQGQVCKTIVSRLGALASGERGSNS